MQYKQESNVNHTFVALRTCSKEDIDVANQASGQRVVSRGNERLGVEMTW